MCFLHQRLFHGLRFVCIGDIHNHLFVRPDTRTFRPAICGYDLLALIQSHSHSEQFQKSSFSAGYVVAAVFVKVRQIACLYLSVPLIA